MDDVGRYPGTSADGTVNGKLQRIIAHCYLSCILLLISQEIKLQYMASNDEGNIFDERNRKIYLFCEVWDSKTEAAEGTSIWACAPAIKDYAPWVERHASYEPWIAFSSNWMLSKIERVKNASKSEQAQHSKNMLASIQKTTRLRSKRVHPSFQFPS
jgi:hypothetical protein